MQWPVLSEYSLIESAPPEVLPDIADLLGVSQNELSEGKEELYGVNISLSPKGQYLAVDLSIFANIPELDRISVAPIKNMVYILDLQSQNSQKLVWSKWDSGNVTDIQWSADENRLLFQYVHRGSMEAELLVYDVQASQIVSVTQGENAVWYADNKHIGFLSRPSPAYMDDYSWTTINVESQESQSIELPEVKGNPYVLVDTMGVIRLLYLGMGKGYYVISELGEDGLTFREVAGINNLFVYDPQVNATGSRLAYQATMRNGEKALGLYDLRTGDQSYVSLNGYDIGDLEWSQTADVILTTGFAEGIRGRQIILLDIEKRVMNVLPKSPELSEDELITGVTW